MATVDVYNMEGAKVGSLDLNDAIFGVEINEHLMHLAVVSQLANKRQGTQSAKGRSDVSGGGRRPWRQKGTGHARQGSIRAAQWKGGGVIWAPKPRDYSVKMNRKEKALAIKSALTSKVEAGKLFVIDSFKVDEIKTKKIASLLKNLNAEKALIVLDTNDEKAILSARNLATVETAQSNTINVFDILKYENLVIAKDAVAQIEAVYTGEVLA